MANEIQEVLQQSAYWTPQLIVSLISQTIWPIIILILGLVLGLKFKAGLISALSSFFGRHNIKELTAGTTGITAKLEAAQQIAKSKEPPNFNTGQLPAGSDYESILTLQESNKTEFSELLFAEIQRQLNPLAIDDDTKIELLVRDASLLHAALKFSSICKALFRSQYDMFELIYHTGSITEDHIEEYFLDIAKLHPEVFSGWDYVKYMSFPMSSGVIEYDNESYNLTILGKSYVRYMKKNAYLITELSDL